MVAAVKHNSFVQNLARAVFNLNTDTCKFALTNSDPTGQETFGAITEITAHNGYAAGGSALTGQSATQTSGVLTFTGTGPTFTASGGTIGPFRYTYLYDSTDTNKDGILHWDYGSNLTLNDGDTLQLVVSGTGILTIT